jgi:hypothetical protein
VALQLLSGDVPRRMVYGHVGWRKIGGDWLYLHAGGAIGADGPAAGVEVSLPDPLAGFRLPDPPTGAELAAAVRASLALLRELAPDRVAFPLLAAVYRAVLGPADFAEHLSCPTGNFKTELATLAQQHYGAEIHARSLPGSWSSTGNALEGVAFAAKDALLVVDDFAPTGSTADVQRSHREADRLLRAQGNRSGRQRMRADGTLRPAKPPRGLILSTGEDVPRGQSLRSRMFAVEISPGDVRTGRLTECQRDAAAGRYAQALAGFLRWLAPRYEDVLGRLRQEAAALRDEAQVEGQHARTPGVVADLALGLRYFLDFAREAGAVTEEEAGRLWQRGWEAFHHVAAEQAAHIASAEPTGQFLRLLSAALASGRAHVAGPDGAAPAGAEGWGWRTKGAAADSGDEWQPQGRRIGWVDADALYLEPDAAYAEAQRLAGEQGESLPVAPRTLWKRLHERGLLQAVETHAGKTRLCLRRTLEGRRREVLSLRADALIPSGSAPSAPPGDNPAGDRDFRRRTDADPTALQCANGALAKQKCAATTADHDGPPGESAHLAHSSTDGEGGRSTDESRNQTDGWGDWT